MSVAALSASPFAGARAPAPTPPFFALLSQLASAKSLRPEERALQGLLGFAADRLGEPLLGAADLVDLEIRLDNVIESVEFGQILALASRVKAPSTGGAATAARSLDQVEDTAAMMSSAFGFGLEEQIRLGLRFSAEVARVTALFQQIQAAAAKSTGAATAQAQANPASDGAAPELLAFLSHPQIHSEVARRLLAGLRACAISFALLQVGRKAGSQIKPRLPGFLGRLERRVLRAYALARAKSGIGIALVAPWLARALIDQWVSNLRAFLQYYASLPDLAVPEDVIPASERLDWERINAELAAREAFYEQAGQQGEVTA